MSRRLLAIEVGGSLGPRVCEYHSSRDKYETVRVTHRELDIEGSVAVSAFMKIIRPNCVLHCTAISNTDTCERNPVLSEKVNVGRTINLAKTCGNVGSRTIFISSDQIYNTSHSMEPNREDSEGKSGNVYGGNKRQTEEVMFTYLSDAVALRLTWIYDASSRGGVAGQRLLQKLADTLKDGWEVEFSVHDYRGTTYVWEMVCHLEEAMGLPGGIYNFGSEDRYSTLNTARPFLKELTRSDSGGILKRNDERLASCPRNLTMDTDKIKSCGIQFFNISEGICKCCMEHRKTSRVSC